MFNTIYRVKMYTDFIDFFNKIVEIICFRKALEAIDHITHGGLQDVHMSRAKEVAFFFIASNVR